VTWRIVALVVAEDRVLLVTGGAGFIGSNFVHYAIGRGWRVVNLDKLTYAANLDNLAGLAGNESYQFVHGDIADRPLVAGLLEVHRPTWVVNFAAESHVDRSIDNPGEFVRTNVVGTFELLLAALGHWRRLPPDPSSAFRFLHVSTDEVFGSLGPTGLFSEGTPYAPNSPYAASKASADHFVRAAHITYGLPTLTTNCSNNYGPYQFPEKLIPLVILNALEGKPLPVYGDGQNVRDWLYVEDHCRAICEVLTRAAPGSTYTVGGRSERKNIDIVRCICALLDEFVPPRSNANFALRDVSVSSYAELIAFVVDRPGHDRRYAVDASAIEHALGWKPVHTFDDGLRKTVRWYLENSAWCGRVSSGMYRRERLGLGVDR
jgi:dTDP-glucose 4,6-dehydratase